MKLHIIDPKLPSLYYLRPHASAYDATHGFSDQYIAEGDAMMSAMHKRKLNVVDGKLEFVPNEEITTVSINFF